MLHLHAVFAFCDRDFCGDGQSNGTGTAEDSCLIPTGPVFNVLLFVLTEAVLSYRPRKHLAVFSVAGSSRSLRLLLKLMIMAIPFFINKQHPLHSSYRCVRLVSSYS